MKLLDNIVWNFTRQDYPKISGFGQDVMTYQTAIMGKRANWNPAEIVVKSPTIGVIYECWSDPAKPLADGEELVVSYIDDDMEEREILCRFTADDGQGFTALELLHKIHQHLLGQDLGDHTFFEGLTPP